MEQFVFIYNTKTWRKSLPFSNIIVWKKNSNLLRRMPWIFENFASFRWHIILKKRQLISFFVRLDFHFLNLYTKHVRSIYTQCQKYLRRTFWWKAKLIEIGLEMGKKYILHIFRLPIVPPLLGNVMNHWIILLGIGFSLFRSDDTNGYMYCNVYLHFRKWKLLDTKIHISLC